MLIRDGALLVRNTADVIEALGKEYLPASPSPQPELNLAPAQKQGGSQRTLRETAALHMKILSRLGPSPIAEDQLIRDLKTVPAKVAPILIDLELEGHVLRQPGGLISRAG